MAKITYLFGAGASYDTLPIVDEIPKALTEFLKEIQKEEFKLPKDQKFYYGRIKREVQEDFIKSMHWLITESGNHSSVDTFAKKLYTRNDRDLLKLKACLSIYFIYEQLKVPAHKRYDSLIASLINPGSIREMLPPNVNALSWNYDFQFEKALSGFRNSKRLSECQALLNVRPSDATINEGSFSLFKLNGTTGFYRNGSSEVADLIDDMTTPVDLSLVDTLMDYYFTSVHVKGDLRSMMCFAWEKNDIAQQVITDAVKTIKDTEVCVVIGYSFPFFNREIDRLIFRSMDRGIIKRIYFQAPPQYVDDTITRFQAIRDDISKTKLIPVKDVTQFFLPPEL